MTNQFDPQTIAAISKLGRRFSDTTILMHEAIAKKVGLTGTDHKYLGIIIQHGKLTAGELSKLTGLTTGAITGLVDRLEKKKLVKRQFDKEDRRKTVIVPDTDKTKQLLGGISEDLQSKTLDFISKFNDNEIQIIEKYLLAAIEMMHGTTISLNKK